MKSEDLRVNRWIILKTNFQEKRKTLWNALIVLRIGTGTDS
jgi:hypothetical protein